MGRLQGSIAGVKDLGLESFEPAVGRDLKGGVIFDVSTEENRREFIKRLKSKNVHICAFLVANDFAKDNVEAEIKWVVDATSLLKVELSKGLFPHLKIHARSKHAHLKEYLKTEKMWFSLCIPQIF